MSNTGPFTVSVDQALEGKLNSIFIELFPVARGETMSETDRTVLAIGTHCDVSASVLSYSKLSMTRLRARRSGQAQDSKE